MKSQFAGIVLFSLILVFVISFGHIGTGIGLGSCEVYGPENLMLTPPTYYVAPPILGSNDMERDGTDPEQPWATISYAMTRLSGVNGYILYVAAGSYADSFSVSSSGTSLISNQIIADGEVTLAPESVDHVIDLNGKSYVEISGFSISTSTKDGILIDGGSSYVTIDSMNISDIGSGGNYAGVSIEGTSGSYPTNITISNCGISGDYYGIELTGYCDTVYINNNEITSGSLAGIYAYDNCDNGYVFDNDITLTTCTNAIKIASGVSLTCDNWKVYRNNISVSASTDGIYLDGVTNPEIYNNIVYGAFTNSIVYDDDSTNLEFDYNTLRMTTGSATMKGYYGNRSSSNPVSSFHNNVISIPSSVADGHTMYIDNTGSYWKPTNSDDISNNLYYGGAYCGYYGTNKSTVSEWQSALGANYDDNTLRADPVFVDSTDCHINETSPCFGAGYNGTSITTDIDGDTRDSNYPNIGADEFNSITISDSETIIIDWSQDFTSITVEEGGAIMLDGSSSSIDMKIGSISVTGYLYINSDVLLKATTFNVNSGGIVYVGDLETEIRAINMTIASGGKISADGAGHDSSEGLGAGTDCTNYGGGGGAYGGDGAIGGCSELGGAGGSADSYNDDYLFYYPHHALGSGGGTGNGTSGGAGGGAICIEVFDTLTINGDITANGADGESDTLTYGATGGGGGAGGGVYIFADTITGSGTISADGGQGGRGYNNLNCGGYGGGGRTAVFHKVNINFDETNQISVDPIVTCPCYNPTDDEYGTIEFKELPSYCKKGTCCDSDASTVGGIYGNDWININDQCLVTQYDITHLDFNDSVSRNFELYYGSQNGISVSESPIGSEGWTHSFNENLDLTDIDDGEITHMLLCGAKVKYQDPENDGTFVAPPFYGDVPPIVEDQSTGYFSMTSKDGTERVFNEDGQFVSLTDVNGDSMTMSYDVNDRLDYVEMADGRAIDIDYSTGSQINTVSCYEKVVGTSPTNQISGSSVSFNYSGGNLSDIGEWEFTYDGYGNLDQQKHEYQTSPTSAYITTDYNIDSEGRVSSISDTSNSMSFSQDQLEHQTTVIDRNGKNWEYESDPIKNVMTSITDPNGNEWTKEYDDKRRLIKITPPQDSNNPNSNSYTEYTYDSKGNVLTQKIVKANDSSSYIYSAYSYDDYNNMTASWGPYANSTDTTSGSNLDKTKIEYDYAVNEGVGTGTVLVSGTAVTGTGTNFDGDIEIGDTITVGTETQTVASITDDTHLTVYSAFSYTYAGVSYFINIDYGVNRRLMQVTRKLGSSDNFVTRYCYDTSGNLIKVINNYGESSARTTEYDYFISTDFSNNQIEGFVEKTTVVVPLGTDLETEYEYYGIGSVKQVTDPTGLVSQYVYNSKGQVLYTCTDPTGEKLGSEYEYDNIGQIKTVKNGSWSVWSLGSTYTFNASEPYYQTDYKYDFAGRLKAVKNRESLGSVYTYDNEGNTLSVMSGEVTAFASSPSIIYTDQAYSQVQYEYNDNGSLKETTSKLDATHNAVVSYTYFPNGSIATVEAPEYNLSNNMESKYEYDYVGRNIKSYVKKVEPQTFVYNETAYDSYGRVSTVTDAESKQISYTYNDYSGRLTKVSNIISTGVDLETDYLYNDFGQVTKVTYAAQGTNSQQIYKFNVYDNIGRIYRTYLGDSSGEVWDDGVNRSEYTYDTVGRMYKKTIKDIDIRNTVDIDIDVEYIFDDLNRIEAVCTDPSSLKEGSKYTYDAIGRVSQVDQVTFSSFSGASSSYAVDSTLLSTKSVYDTIGRLQKSVVNPVVSNPSRLEDITTYYDYDELSRVVKVIDPEQWYANSRAESGADHTAYTYDNASRLIEVAVHADLEGTGAADYTIAQYAYFNNGARSSMSYTQDYTSQTWIDVSYSYNPTGTLNSVTYPGYSNNDVYSYTYYDNGVLDTVSLDGSSLFDYDYDDAWRLTEIKAGGATDKKFEYNDRSQIQYIKDSGDNIRYEYAYDTFGRVSSTKDSTESVFSNKQITYTYTGAGLRKTMVTPDYDIQYNYDNAGRYSMIERKVSGVYEDLAEYSYNGLGQRTGYTRYDNTGANVVVHTEYDYLENVGWLQYVENRKQIGSSGTNVISAYKYYDSTEGDNNDLVGNREYMEYLDGSYVEYDYDPLYRLTTETRKNSGGVQQAKYEFTYDLAGNRETQSRYSTTGTWSSYHTYDYNNANQLTLEKRYNQSGGTQDKETQYVYNDLGNLIEKNIETSNFSTPDYNDDIWDYTYDAYNRVTSIYRDDNASHKVGEYKFNMLGNRVQKKTYDEYWQLDDTIKMLYDGYDCVADYDENTTLLRYYITPILDENVLVYDEETTDEEYFYLHDGLGTVRQIINDTQTIENNYDYEGFGTSLSYSENIYNRYRYTGREYDKETESDPTYNSNEGTKDGLYYYRARTYDSTIGSFTSRDPIREPENDRNPIVNLYYYVKNNPNHYRDPHGKESWDIDCVLKLLCCTKYKYVVEKLAKMFVVSYSSREKVYKRYRKNADGSKGEFIREVRTITNGSATSRTIRISTQLNCKDAAAVLVHEVQHTIQTVEGRINREVDARRAEEQFRIDKGIPPHNKTYRKEETDEDGNKTTTIDEDAIREHIRDLYRASDSPYIDELKTDSGYKDQKTLDSSKFSCEPGKWMNDSTGSVQTETDGTSSWRPKTGSGRIPINY